MKDQQPDRPPKEVITRVERVERAVLCTMLSAMILLACLQIALRTFFDSGLAWADPMLRYLVLWSGLLGAVMATGKGNHIALDLAGYLTPKRYLPLVRLICHLFSVITAGFLTYAAILFLKSEMEFSIPGLFDIPSWVWNIIFPLAFMLITLRYAILLWLLVLRLIRHKYRPQPDW